MHLAAPRGLQVYYSPSEPKQQDEAAAAAAFCGDCVAGIESTRCRFQLQVLAVAASFALRVALAACLTTHQ